MSSRVILLILLAVQVFLIIGFKLFNVELLYYLSLILGIATVGYAFSIQCHACGRRQVFRGLSAFDLRLPGEKCYFCKCDLNK
jgi:hypothetical protein